MQIRVYTAVPVVDHRPNPRNGRPPRAARIRRPVPETTTGPRAAEFVFRLTRYLLYMMLMVAAVLVAGATAGGAAQPVVQLPGAGKARGVGTANGGAYFLSLPFAAPPVNEKRWLPPLPVRPWPGTLDATAYKPACAQAADWTGQPEPSIPGGGQGSEDCLYLDVYSPSLQAQKAGPLAVALFIHGGGFTGGDSAGGKIGPGGALPGVPFSTRFNGTFMAEAQQVVVVSVNYRLGIFGFLGSEQLAARTTSALGKPMGTGNYGIQDQRAAMAWVQ